MRPISARPRVMSAARAFSPKYTDGNREHVFNRTAYLGADYVIGVIRSEGLRAEQVNKLVP